MRGAYELDRERAYVHDLARLDAVNQHVVEQVVLFELAVGEPRREVRGVNWHIKFFEDVGERAQVILVPVREHDGRNVVPVLFEELEVRDRDVYAVDALLWKTHTGVDDDHLVFVAHGHTIHPELADSAERDDL